MFLDTKNKRTQKHTLQRCPNIENIQFRVSHNATHSHLYKSKETLLHKAEMKTDFSNFFFLCNMWLIQWKCWKTEKTIQKTKSVTYLPIFVSSSSSDGARLFRRHNVAIIPMCNVKQHTKSMISKSNRTAPTATAIRDADVTGLAGTTRSRPKRMVTKRNTEIPIRSICFFCSFVGLGVLLLFRCWDGAFECMYYFFGVCVCVCIVFIT